MKLSIMNEVASGNKQRRTYQRLQKWKTFAGATLRTATGGIGESEYSDIRALDIRLLCLVGMEAPKLCLWVSDLYWFQSEVLGVGNL